MPTSLLPGHWAGLSNLDGEQISLIEETARAVGGNPEHLAKVIWHESRFNPQAQYGYVYGPPQFIPRVATGLIQFIPSTASRLGTSTEALFNMTFSQQMAYVRRYLELVASGQWAGGGSGPLDTQEKMALAVFYPAYRNRPLDTPLPQSARDANPGVYTLGDYVNRVLKPSSGFGRGAPTRHAASSSVGTSSGMGAALLVGGVLIGGIALYLVANGE